MDESTEREPGLRLNPINARAKDENSSQAKTKRLPTAAVAIALITGIGAIWFAVQRERSVALVAPASKPNPTPMATPSPTSTPVPLPIPIAIPTPTKAIADYTAAIRLNPRDADAYYNRGLSYKSKGKLRKAKADFAKANQLNKPGQ